MEHGWIHDYIRFILAWMDEEADRIDIILDPMYYPSKRMVNSVIKVLTTMNQNS